MTRELTHDEAFVMLDAAALDVLDPAERDAVLAHVAGCEICPAELATLREAASQLAFAAPAASSAGSRERIHSRLMDRVAADARARGVVPLQPPVSSPSSSASSPPSGRGGWRHQWRSPSQPACCYHHRRVALLSRRAIENLRKGVLKARLARTRRGARTSTIRCERSSRRATAWSPA